MSQSRTLGEKAFESPDESPPPLEALPSAPQRSLSSIQSFLTQRPPTNQAPELSDALSSTTAISTPSRRGVKRERSRERQETRAPKQERKEEAAEATTPTQSHEHQTSAFKFKRPASAVKVKQQQQQPQHRSFDDEDGELLFDAVPTTHLPHPSPPLPPTVTASLPHTTSSSTALVPSGSDSTSSSAIESQAQDQDQSSANAELYCAVCRQSVPVPEQRSHWSSMMHMFQMNLARTPAAATEKDQKALATTAHAPRSTSRPSSAMNNKSTNKLTKGAKRQLRKNMQHINQRLDDALRSEFAGLYRMGPG